MEDSRDSFIDRQSTTITDVEIMHRKLWFFCRAAADEAWASECSVRKFSISSFSIERVHSPNVSTTRVFLVHDHTREWKMKSCRFSRERDGHTKYEEILKNSQALRNILSFYRRAAHLISSHQQYLWDFTMLSFLIDKYHNMSMCRRFWNRK